MPHMHETSESLVRDVERFKTALSHLLLSRAVETSNAKVGSFLYLLSKMVSELKVAESPAVDIIGVHGDTLYVGPMYSKLIESIMRKKPEDVAKLKAFLILHEALHRVFGHDVRIALAGDKMLYNIVADLYVNTVLEHQLGLGGFEGFVTLKNLADFIIEHFGTQLSREQVEAVKRLGSYEVENKLSVEQVYNTLAMLPKKVVDEVKSKYGAGRFYGKDLSHDQRSEAGARKVESAGASEQSGGKQASQESLEKDGSISVGGAARDGRELSKTLDRVSSELKELAQRIDSALGEYQALRRLHEGKSAGTVRGVAGYQEYRQLSSLLLQVHRLFMYDVGETFSEPKTTFERFDDEAYWLPAREVERRKAVLALIDASPSVPRKHLNLFLSCVVNSVHTFDLEYRLVLFGAGVLDEKVVTVENVDAEIRRVPRGGGTVWDKTVAERVRDAMRRGIRLIQVLSDFWIIVTDEASQAIAEFKNAGGKISCYSSSGSFLDFCDTMYELPTLPEK